MNAVDRCTDKALRAAAPVAAVTHRAAQLMAGAVLTHPAIPQQDSVGAEDAEIVQGLHDRHALKKTRPEH